MTVRTISQLPAITMKEELDGSCYFETSKPIDATKTKYTSKKVPYSVINDRIQEDSKSFLSTQYGMLPGMNFGDMQHRIDDLYFHDVTLSGEVTFGKLPVTGTSKEPIATQSYVKEQINLDTATVIGPESVKVFEIKDDDLVFNEGISYTKSKILKIPANVKGNLILWGWMADQGTDMHPAKAWVALKRVDSATDMSDGLILQVHPWILGSFRNQLQYVSFGVPVNSGTTGMYIRIDSGFEVGEETSGSQTAGSSLADSTPNKFVGYVLGKRES